MGDPLLVHHFLERSARRFPDKAALVVGDDSLTYAEVNEHANRIAHTLIAAGVQSGDRVAIHLPNSVEAVIAIFGALKASAAFVMVNPSVKPKKLDYILRDAAIRFVFLPSHKAGKLAPVFAATGVEVAITVGDGDGVPEAGPTRYVSWHEALAGGSGGDPGGGVQEKDLAALIYTSGSTGDPKGVVCYHENVVFAAGSIIEYLSNTETDVVINALPLSFDYGLYQVLMVFRFGGTLVLQDGFAFPAVILRQVERHKVSGLPGVPTMFATLLKLDLDRYDLSSLRYLTNTAAALPVSHIERLRRSFPQAELVSMYGLTECKRALYLPPEELDRRPGSVGIAIPGTRAWIEDESGHRLEPGHIGELVVRGRHVMGGYWNKPEESRRFQSTDNPSERLLYTDDLFRQDGDGFFYFVGRQDDIIKTRGEKVAPKEIESVLYEIRGILEACVVGEADPLLGESIKAMIVTDGADLTEQEVLRYCRQHLEDFMVPHSIEFKDSLPKTDSGKIVRSSGGK